MKKRLMVTLGFTASFLLQGATFGMEENYFQDFSESDDSTLERARHNQAFLHEYFEHLGRNGLKTSSALSEEEEFEEFDAKEHLKTAVTAVMAVNALTENIHPEDATPILRLKEQMAQTTDTPRTPSPKIKRTYSNRFPRILRTLLDSELE